MKRLMNRPFNGQNLEKALKNNKAAKIAGLPANFAALFIEKIKICCKCLHLAVGIQIALIFCKEGDLQWKNDYSSQDSCLYS